MSSPVEEIKAKLGIVEVIGSYIQVENAGQNFKAKCPFHNEKTPSFYISPARNSYYCFGCSAKGDIFSFVQQFEGLDFVGALKVLAKRAGVELQRENPTVRTEREKLHLIMEHATIFFQLQLSKKDDAKQYILKRGLKPETVKMWRLGYAPVEWKGVASYLTGKGFTLADIEKVGLIKKSDKGSGDYYDRFRGRIMFPIFDSSGRVIAFSGRQFESDGTEAKYLNSPETVLFEKSKVLYGYDKAKLEIRKKDYALLVEGQMDLLMCHQSGFSNAVASSGTALTKEQLELIKRLSSHIVIAYDSDDAGNNAASRGWQLALEVGLQVKIVMLPEKKDPADMLLESPETFEQAIASARHIIEVKLELIRKQTPSMEERRTKIETEVLPLIANLQSETEKARFAVLSSYEAKISETIIWEAIRKLTKTKVQSYVEKEPVKLLMTTSRLQSLQRNLASVHFWSQIKTDKNTVDLDIYQKICTIIGTDLAEKLFSDLEQKKDELIFEAELSLQNSSNILHHTTDLLLNFEEEWLREQFAEAMRELQIAERNRDSEAITKLLSTCQDISNKLRTITQRIKNNDEK